MNQDLCYQLFFNNKYFLYKKNKIVDPMVTDDRQSAYLGLFREPPRMSHVPDQSCIHVTACEIDKCFAFLYFYIYLR